VNGYDRRPFGKNRRESIMVLKRTDAARRVLVAAGLAVVCLVGCAEKDPAGVAKGPAKVPAAAPVVPAAAESWQTPTDEECQQFAKSLEQIVQSGDLTAFNNVVDWDAILEKATSGFPGVEKARRQFIAGVKQTVGHRTGIGWAILGEVAKGGSYKFLHVHTQYDQKRVLFRFLLAGQQGVNYHDFILVRQSDGKIRAVDLYIFLSAEMLSTAIRRGFIPVVAEASKSVLAKLTGAESEYVKHAKVIAQMPNAVVSGNYQQALEIYRRLPPALQKDKNILMLRLRAAQATGDKALHATAIDDFRRYHPDDPCVDILAIDVHILNKRYDEALKCIDRLDVAVGGDPYLDVLRASSRIVQGDYAAARAFAQKAIDAEELLIDAYWTLVTIALAEKNFDETTRLLNLIIQKFNVEIGDLSGNPPYAEYIKSPQYKQWMQSRLLGQ
jgi:tetratricopeptide (TPR) repeat protein